MRNTLFMVAVACFSAVSAFAGQPLYEDFESFKFGTKTGEGVYSSNSQWRAHNVQMVQIGVVENPNKTGINQSSKVLKIDRAVCDTLSQNKFAGKIAFRGAKTQSFEIPLTVSKSIIEVKVLHVKGGQVGIRIYPDKDKTGKEDYKIVTANVPASNDWQTVKFDFSALVSSMTAFPLFQFEVEKRLTIDAQKPQLTVYIDDIKLIEK